VRNRLQLRSSSRCLGRIAAGASSGRELAARDRRFQGPQAYAHGTSGLHHTPPWASVLVCDPATGREVRVGEKGLVRWIDLANTDSVLAVQTLDLAERTPQGFRLIGRMARTEPRGCSLSAEDIAAHREPLSTP
jgi:hypothetical protein